jgi:hypothetical protein
VKWIYAELHGPWAHNCGPVAFAVECLKAAAKQANRSLRRRGLATRLLKAIVERFPKLTGVSTA